MKITKRQLRQIIKEEKAKLIRESFGMSTDGEKMRSGRPSVGTYGQQVEDARRYNSLPPESSNWYEFAKDEDLGVLDLDKFASLVNMKNFSVMDASISPERLEHRDPERFYHALGNVLDPDDIGYYGQE